MMKNELNKTKKPIAEINSCQLADYLFGHIRTQYRPVPLSNSNLNSSTDASNIPQTCCNDTHNQYGPDWVDSHILDPYSFPPYISCEEHSIQNFSHISVVTHIDLLPGMVLGEVEGQVVPYSKFDQKYHDESCCWEIDELGERGLVFCAYKHQPNWLKRISKARTYHEQNVDVRFDDFGTRIMFIASRYIPRNTELLVWYPFAGWYEALFGLRQPILPKPVANIEATANDRANSVEMTEREKEIETPGQYPCDKCGRVFSYQFYLRNHQTFSSCVDNPNRKFACTQCKRTFEKADRLRVHVRQVHEKIRPYKCLSCLKTFSQSSSLTKHTRIHTGSRPYECAYCEKRFTASSILSTHIRQHTGEKPFVCKICLKAFASHAAHHSHVRRNHAKEKTETATETPAAEA